MTDQIRAAAEDRMRWSLGDRLILQEVWEDRLWSARPMIVVEDSPHRLTLWKPAGTTFQLPWPPPGIARHPRAERIAGCMERRDWIFEPAEWPVSTLWFLYPGRFYSIWISWHPTGDLWGWYVNFQRPFTRQRDRIHTMDLALDLVVDTDLGWEWKDRDEYDHLRSRGLITDAEAQHIRKESELIQQILETGGSPFNEPWDRWTPDVGWGIPNLPSDWRALT